MNRPFDLRIRLAAVLTLCVAAAAVAQNAKPESTPQTDPTNPSLWNADRMMEDAVQTLVRRYNLNPEQEAFTREVLVSRTKKFLKQHEGELRSLLRDQLVWRIDSSRATPENYRMWAERARPVFEAAQREILDGNKDWREILNEDQKRIHDADLGQMQGQFTHIDGLITKWNAGKFDPADLSPTPPPQLATAPQGGVSRLSDRPPTVTNKPEDIWESYVKRYGDVYQLNPDQRNAAYAVLQSSRAEVRSYRDSRKDEFSSLEKRLVEATVSGQTSAKAIELRKSLADLERPVYDIFTAMRNRLEQVPTKAQRESAAKEQVASLDSMARTISPASVDVVQPPTTVAPGDKPTSSRPAQTAAPASRPAK